MEKEFIITIVRSGGFAGISSTVRVDSNTLSENEKKTLFGLIQSSGVFNKHHNDIVSPLAKDSFQYILTIEDGTGVKSVKVFEPTPALACHDLYKHLKSLSKK